jgi:phenylalanyl-tRNA synthetase beta chain
MKFTLSWLKDHLDTASGLEEITTTLTAIGLEVEQVSDPASTLAAFTVAYIKDAVPHPNADKLRVCTVDDGKEIRQIVCGAANARAGIKVALAREGVTIPANGMVLKKTKIRGVDSNGMLCSAEELGLDDKSDGIIELPDHAVIGDSIVKTLRLDDPLIEIAITPNRSDCLGIRGIARDLAAAGLGALKPMVIPTPKATAPSKITVTIEDENACPMFVGCTITGVRNGPSPEWLQRKLKSVGLRPISTLVDITNLFTMDLGRPLHVYDIKKLKGNIRVTKAKNGETLATLNDKTYTLDDRMIAIADDSGTIGLGGIIGGTSTGVDETTTDVFLECALFNPSTIMETGRKLSLVSDARYRFERGVDPLFPEDATLLAASVIMDLCGGTASKITVAGKSPYTAKSISFIPSHVKSLSGIEVSETESLTILESLGFEVAGDTQWTVVPPAFRPDIEGPADLVEEIARIKGFVAIPSTPLPVRKTSETSLLNTLQKRQHAARRLLASRGLIEVISWAFTSSKDAGLFSPNSDSLKLLNPIASDLDIMRPCLLPNLLQAVKKNTDRGFADLALFEVGAQFHDISPEGQKIVATVLLSGNAAPRNVYKSERSVDAMDAKSEAFAVLQALGVNAEKAQLDRVVPDYYHPTRSGRISLGGKMVLAYFGELHPGTLHQMDIKSPVVACEILLENIPTPKVRATKAKPSLTLSNFQSVERDFAFVVDAKIEASQLLSSVQSVDKTLITGARVFDVFQGKGIEDGKKSIALTITLQAMDRTLTDQEIEQISSKVIGAASALGATLR